MEPGEAYPDKYKHQGTVLVGTGSRIIASAILFAKFMIWGTGLTSSRWPYTHTCTGSTQCTKKSGQKKNTWIWERKVVGNGSRFDQDPLYACIKFSGNNAESYCLEKERLILSCTFISSCSNRRYERHLYKRFASLGNSLTRTSAKHELNYAVVI